MNQHADVPGGELPLILASIARPEGITGVHTHVRQLRRYLEEQVGSAPELVTPHTWPQGSMRRDAAQLMLFGVRPVLERAHGPAHVRWYRASHEHFLRLALRDRLADAGPCIVYAQCPVSARAALDARAGEDQRVVMAVHFRISQADEWADKTLIRRGGLTYRSIRDTEREVVGRVDAMIFVSAWARSALCDWLPEAADVRATVVNNFVKRHDVHGPVAPAGDLVSVGNLEAVKNHRFLLRVLAAAAQKGQRYTLDVFGEGVEHRRLIALARDLGVSEQLRLRGFCRDVQDRLPGYRAYAHASYSESSSLAIMEAMGAGLPVLSSTAGALTELFDDRVHGRFWPIDDPERAARIMIELLESPAGLAAAGRAAQEKFCHDYDADRVAPRLLGFLQSVAC